MRLEARGITKTFGENQALRGVNLSLPECHSLAIIGPSGGGKTTLLRIVAGLAVPDTGSLAIDGREVAFNENDLLAHRRSIGTVFQASSSRPTPTGARPNSPVASNNASPSSAPSPSNRASSSSTSPLPRSTRK